MYKYKESGDRKLNQLTTGYWINPDGKLIPIYDHFEYLLEHQEEFGIEQDETKGISFTDKEKRVEFLLRAMKNNWIRVRQLGIRTSIECWKLTERTLLPIKMFCKKINVWDSDIITINEISRKSSYPLRAKDLFSEKAIQLITKKN
ncbi:hypothetical protein ES703_62771 [subsurface metagenome]